MLLNTIVKVQGGQNTLISSPAIDADHTQARIVFAAKIPLVVEVMVLVVLGLLLCLLLLLRLYSSKFVVARQSYESSD
jgi:hypothetical protein